MANIPSIDLSFLDRGTVSPQRTAINPREGDGSAPQAMDAGALAELNFTDLYLTVEDKDEAFYREGPNGGNGFALNMVPPNFAVHMQTLRSQLAKQVSKSGIIDFGSIRLRFETSMMADGKVRAAIRRIPVGLPLLTDLSMSAAAVKALRVWSNERGLILIGGATGNGKTTTAVAILLDYLRTRPGIAVTIEDPPEYAMQGNLGTKGHCFQIEVRGDDEWETAVNTVLRWRPRYVMLGEIRCPEAAAQALRASTSGHLVIATVHGGALDEAADTVLRLAEAGMGEGARRLLAHNLIGVVRQQLSLNGPDLDYINLRRGDASEAVQTARRGILDGNTSLLRKYGIQLTATQA